MLNVLVKQLGSGVVTVRPWWEEKEEEMGRLLSWEKRRFDLVALTFEELSELGIEPPRSQTFQEVKAMRANNWLAFVAAATSLKFLSEGPKKLEWDREPVFDAFVHWSLKSALGFEQDEQWAIVPCGDHFHLIMRDENGEEHHHASKYGFSIPSMMTAEEYEGMLMAEEMNNPLHLLAELLENLERLRNEEATETEDDLWLSDADIEFFNELLDDDV